MKITYIALGTRGDVQPAIALGKALKAQGHQVRLLAAADFKGWIEGHGLEAAVSKVDMQGLMEGEIGQQWIEHGHNPRVQLGIIRRMVDEIGWDMVTDAWSACQDAEGLITSLTSDLCGLSFAEKLGIKQVSTLLQPTLIATRDGRSMINAPFPNRVSMFNYWFSKIFIERALWVWYGQVANRFRREVLKLPEYNRQQYGTKMVQLPVMHGYSPLVVPRPADWPANLHVTGYWFLDGDQDWNPPAALTQFLDAGEAPVYIGFGSMTGRDAQALTQLVVDAVKQSERRAVLLSGWAGLGDYPLPETIFRLESAPHNWLFPRMAAVVHHGGAGTTAAALRAGVPSVIVPHIADQFFWAKRIEALGVGSKSIPRYKLTTSVLTQAIRSVTSDSQMKQRAIDLGEKIRAEDGVNTAVKLIIRYLGA